MLFILSISVYSKGLHFLTTVFAPHSELRYINFDLGKSVFSAMYKRATAFNILEQKPMGESRTLKFHLDKIEL